MLQTCIRTKTWRKCAILFLLLFIMGSLSACGTKKVTSIVLSTSSIELTQDESFQLTYAVFPDNATEALSWKSLDETIVSVNENGCLQALKPGNTSVTLSVPSGVNAVCNVVVKEKSAYDRLSSNDKKFVDLFLPHLSVFKNPSSVEIIGILDTDSTETYAIKISAQNGFGGNSVSVYDLQYGSKGHFYKGYFGENEFEKILTFANFDGFDIELINEAIHEMS